MQIFLPHFQYLFVRYQLNRTFSLAIMNEAGLNEACSMEEFPKMPKDYKGFHVVPSNCINVSSNFFSIYLIQSHFEYASTMKLGFCQRRLKNEIFEKYFTKLEQTSWFVSLPDLTVTERSFFDKVYGTEENRTWHPHQSVSLQCFALLTITSPSTQFSGRVSFTKDSLHFISRSFIEKGRYVH